MNVSDHVIRSTSIHPSRFVSTFSFGNKTLPRGIMSVLMSFLNFQNQLALSATSHSLSKIYPLIDRAYPGAGGDFYFNTREGFDITIKDMPFLNKFSITHLDLHYCCSITDAGLTNLSNLTSLQNLNLSSCRSISGIGFGALSNLTSLQVLDLCGDSISDISLVKLSTHLVLLQALNLSYCDNLTNASLDSLINLTSLKILSLEGCKFLTNSRLAHLSSHLISLKSLALTNCPRISDRGVAHLNTSLERLKLASCRLITDTGVASLSKLTSLQCLNLSECAITDRGVTYLSTLTSLHALTLTLCSGITKTSINSLSNLIHLTVHIFDYYIEPWRQQEPGGGLLLDYKLPCNEYKKFHGSNF